jgi:aminoglycoside phosphotransferase (APT) family kinase protein
MSRVEETFKTRLTQVVAQRFPEAVEIVELARLSGGASRETWSFAVILPDGRRDLILRRAPGLKATASSLPLSVEARLMEYAARGRVPSPPVLYVLQPGDELGDGFLMEHVPGETIPRKILRDAEFAEVRQRLAFDLGTILARIHAITPDGTEGLRTISARLELNELYAAYEADGCPRPVFDLAFRYLNQRCPSDPERPTLVHGDFRNGNLIVGPDGVRAVLDWELAHLGDPMEDLGWLCVNSWRFGTIHQPVGGFGPISDLIAGYEAESGRKVDLAEIVFWQTLGTLRWGVICLGMLASFEGGEERSIERAMIGRRASETELDLLRLLAPRDRPGR